MASPPLHRSSPASSSTRSSSSGVNDDELVDLIEFGRPIGAEVRFIEYMDVGGATHWSMPRVMPRREMLERLEQHYGAIAPLIEESSAPADRYRLPDGMTFGIISSTTEPFCDSCDRSRLTADGLWYLCLYATHGTDLRRPLRSGRRARSARPAHSRHVGSAQRPRRRRTTPQSRPLAADPRGSSEARPAPRDAYERRLTTARDFTCPTNRGEHGGSLCHDCTCSL